MIVEEDVVLQRSKFLTAVKDSERPRLKRGLSPVEHLSCNITEILFSWKVLYTLKLLTPSMAFYT